MKSREMPPPDWSEWSHAANLSAVDAAALTMNFCPIMFRIVASESGLAFGDATVFEKRLRTLNRSCQTRLSAVDLATLARRLNWEDIPAELADLANPTTAEAAPRPAGEPTKHAAEITGKERTTVLKLIGGLAICGHGMDIHASRLTGIDDLHADLTRVGVPIDQDTLRKWLKLAAEVIDRPTVGKTSAR